MVFFALILAFGFGPGLNPPLDIHVPDSEELKHMTHEEDSFSEEKIQEMFREQEREREEEERERRREMESKTCDELFNEWLR